MNPKTNIDPTKVESVLAEAQRIIEGPRRNAYGSVEHSFKNIADVFSVILQKKLTSPISSREVAQLMIGLKLCRDANKPDRENIVDIAGYAALAENLK